MLTVTESLGGVESLCEVPATMTHKGMPARAREESGVFGNLGRLSIGLEDVQDLKDDSGRALVCSAAEAG